MLPFRGRPLLTGPWLLNSIPHWRHSLQGTRQNWTDFSHHAQLSMCTSRDKMAASGMEFSVLIECEFVVAVSWKVGWWCFFSHKICTRPIGRLVSQFYSSLGCFYPSGTTGRVVSSNTDICVRSWRGGCLVTWFCYNLITKPRNKTATPSWPDPYDCIQCPCYHISKKWWLYMCLCMAKLLPGPVMTYFICIISNKFSGIWINKQNFFFQKKKL